MRRRCEARHALYCRHCATAAAAPHAALGPGAHQCAAALGKMHDDRPSLNGVRTIMHLAKYETLLRRNSLYADDYSWPGFEACRSRMIRLGSAGRCGGGGAVARRRSSFIGAVKYVGAIE